MRKERFTLENMTPLFWILKQTHGIKQLPEYHPEGDVLTHLLQSVHIAFRETSDIDLILAAMLHDVGKISGLMGHERVSVEYLSCHLGEKALWLIDQHMRVWTFLEGDMKRLGKIRGLVEHRWFPELVHLARIDKMARDPNKNVIYNPDRIVAQLNKCDLQSGLLYSFICFIAKLRRKLIG